MLLLLFAANDTASLRKTGTGDLTGERQDMRAGKFWLVRAPTCDICRNQQLKLFVPPCALNYYPILRVHLSKRFL